MNASKKLELATLGGGCFWCTEAIFKNLKGVTAVTPGYAGGHTANPTYEQVCSGTTGHAEVARVSFDLAIISYESLLGIFFATHDPTQLNRQRNDIGEQYRSIIFFHSARQERAARALVASLNQQKIFSSPIVTAIEPLQQFYPAENYHHDYFTKNPGQPYCKAVISPKLSKFRKKFLPLLK